MIIRWLLFNYICLASVTAINRSFTSLNNSFLDQKASRNAGMFVSILFETVKTIYRFVCVLFTIHNIQIAVS